MKLISQSAVIDYQKSTSFFYTESIVDTPNVDVSFSELDQIDTLINWVPQLTRISSHGSLNLSLEEEQIFTRALLRSSKLVARGRART
jgi:hypothetical protein